MVVSSSLDEVDAFSDMSLPPPPPTLSLIGESKPGQTLPPNPVVFLSFECSIYTTTAKGGKAWVKSLIQVKRGEERSDELTKHAKRGIDVQSRYF